MPLSNLQKNNRNWIGVIIAFYAFVVMGISNHELGVLLPSLQATYNLTPGSITILFLGQMTGSTVAALTSSLVSNRIGLSRMLLLSSIMLTSALVICACTNDWFIMVASLAILGMGNALINAGMSAYMASERRNSNLIAWLYAFYSIGALLGSAFATTLLAMGWDWRAIYLKTAGLAGVIVVAMIWVTVSNYKLMSYVTVSDTDSKANLRLALSMPTVIVSGLLCLIYVGVEVSIGNWAYSIQSISRSTPELLAGYSVSAYWLGLTVGRLGMGYLMKQWGAVHTLNFSFTLLMSGLVIWCLFPNQLLSLPLIGFGLAVIYPATIWLLPRRVEVTLVPAAIGFVASVTSLGSAATLTLVGLIAEHLGLESIPIIMVVLGSLMIFLNRWLVKYTVV
ncbi:MFS transporter [Nostoc sp. C117]|uniref:MFS transporter n=1 Tax=Nostoc sp. C117 TaxID=3349875 RepID=UPI00370D6430